MVALDLHRLEPLRLHTSTASNMPATFTDELDSSPAWARTFSSSVMRPCLSMATSVTLAATERRRVRVSSPRFSRSISSRAWVSNSVTSPDRDAAFAVERHVAAIAELAAKRRRERETTLVVDAAVVDPDEHVA